jgi:uncharacterized protein YciI
MNHFVVTFSFNVPVESIGEDLINQHLARLMKGYKLGYVLLFGPREPEDGTLAIIRAESRQSLASALASDPLLKTGIATYEFSEFIPVRFPTSLQGWVDPLGFHTSITGTED